MPTALYHLNTATERISLCRAEPEIHRHRGCPFGSSSPHFASKEAARSYYESELESEYGLFGADKSLKPLPLDRASVARRLNLLPEEALAGLILDRFRHGGYTPREAQAAVDSGEPFYVSYSGNQELTLELDSGVTQRTFTRGACSVFALELHRATGWPLVVYTDDSVAGTWMGHAAVRTPTGELLDAAGVSDSPRAIFGPIASEWRMSEALTVEEFFEHMQPEGRFDRQADRLAWEKLPLLERFVASKLAYDALEQDGFLH